MKKFKGLSIALASVLAINGFAFSKKAAAADTQDNTTAKVASIQQDNKVNGSYGYIPSGIKVKKSDKYYKSTQLPAQYDLRSSGYVTPIRNQGSLPSCWTFSTYGSLESVEKKKHGQTYNFSEINMATHNGVVAANEGGNNLIASAYLVAWKGPVLESDDPYPNSRDTNNITVRDGIPARYHVQDIIYLPSRTSSADNLEIKNAIMQYGAVSSSYYHNDSYYIDKGQAAYYCDEAVKGNHAITIIGWDDNFDQDNFLKQPPAPGAFLCKNSWGDDWGDNGYYYISYYDANLGTDSNAVFNGLESKNNYNNLYSNTDKPQTHYYYNTQYAGNRYTANGEEFISAVGFYTFAQDVSYEIYVDKLNGSTVSKPVNMVESGNLPQGGYHTVKLDNIVKVSKDEQFMIWIKLIGDDYWGSLESSSVNSYYIDGMGINNAQIAFGINAYTMNYDPSTYISIASEDPANGELTVDKPVTLTYSDNISPGSGFNNISLKDENNVEVSKSVTISGNKLIVKETPQNHLNGQLKLYVPKDAVKNANGKYNYFDYNETYNVYAADSTIVKFKDEVLEKLIRIELNKPSGDITVLDMKKIEIVDCWDLGVQSEIVSLAGLEYAYNLKELSVPYNNIISLQPLKNLRNLTYLVISNNNIKDLSPLSQLINLKELYVNNNYIRDISPLQNLKNLNFLYVSKNQISDISNLDNLTNLQIFDITYNLVRNIGFMEGMAMNGASSYLYIYMEGNYIDFSAGSAASKTLTLLDTTSARYSGENSQNSGLQLVTVNGESFYYPDKYYLDMSSGQRIVCEFSEPVSLAANVSSLISLNNKYEDGSYKINLKTSGNTLIITPLSEIPKDTELSLNIGTGAVINRNNTSIKNQSLSADIFTDSDRYGDFNKDNSVTILDLAQLSEKYNTTIDKAADWDSAKDLNEDGVIDIYDLTIMGSYIK